MEPIHADTTLYAPTPHYTWRAWRGDEDIHTHIYGYGITRTAAILALWYEEAQILDVLDEES